MNLFDDFSGDFPAPESAKNSGFSVFRSAPYRATGTENNPQPALETK
jgi:hypothetical protein